MRPIGTVLHINKLSKAVAQVVHWSIQTANPALLCRVGNGNTHIPEKLLIAKNTSVNVITFYQYCFKCYSLRCLDDTKLQSLHSLSSLFLIKVPFFLQQDKDKKEQHWRVVTLLQCSLDSLTGSRWQVLKGKWERDTVRERERSWKRGGETGKGEKRGEVKGRREEGGRKCSRRGKMNDRRWQNRQKRGLKVDCRCLSGHVQSRDIRFFKAATNTDTNYFSSRRLVTDILSLYSLAVKVKYWCQNLQ